MDQTRPHRSHGPMRPARPMRPTGAAPRAGMLRAMDAASRPEKRLFDCQPRNQVTGAVDICTLGVHNLANN
jgi:hypothetical protein